MHVISNLHHGLNLSNYFLSETNLFLIGYLCNCVWSMDELSYQKKRNYMKGIREIRNVVINDIRCEK